MGAQEVSGERRRALSASDGVAVDAEYKSRAFAGFQLALATSRELRDRRGAEFGGIVDALVSAEEVIDDDIRKLAAAWQEAERRREKERGHKGKGDALAVDLNNVSHRSMTPGDARVQAVSHMLHDRYGAGGNAAPARGAPAQAFAGSGGALAADGDDAALVDVSKWLPCSLTCDDVVARLIIYASEIGDNNPVGLRLILSALSTMLERARDNEREHALYEAQCRLDELGAVAMVARQMTVPRASLSPMYVHVVKTATLLLEEGNTLVQQRLLNLLAADPTAWMAGVRRRLSRVSSDFREGAATAEGIEVALAVMRLLQVMCEGHHAGLQNFLRDQVASARGKAVRAGMRSVDLVGATCSFLETLAAHVDAGSIELVVQCLDTVIEFVQGPCKANQVLIVHANFVEVASSLLAASLSPASAAWATSPAAARDAAKEVQYKCALGLASLFEGATDSDVHTRVIAQVDVRVLHTVMSRVYDDLWSLHDGEYVEAAFHLPFDKSGFSERHESPAVDDGDRETAGLETGFNLYVLMRRLMDFSPEFAAQVALVRSAHQSQQQLDAARDRRERRASKASVASSAASEREQVSSKGSVGAAEAEEGGDGGGGACCGCLTRLQRRRKHGHAFAFFSRHCTSVEVVRDGVMERMFFAIPPICNNLTGKTKHTFVWEVERDTASRKIEGLFSWYPQLLAEMLHQQWLRDSLGGVPLLRTFTTTGETWKNQSFLLAIIINALVLLCYSSGQSDDDLALGVECTSKLAGVDVGLPIDDIISWLGIAQTGTSSIVVFLFYMNYGCAARRAPPPPPLSLSLSLAPRCVALC